MAMVAHDPKAAKRLGIPQSVGKEFTAADKGKKFGSGGAGRPDRQTINQPKTSHGKSALFSKGGHVMATKKMSMGGDTTGKGASKEKRGLTMEKMGSVKTAAPSRDGLAERGKTKARMPKMAGSTIGGGMKKGGMAKKK